MVAQIGCQFELWSRVNGGEGGGAEREERESVYRGRRG